MTGETYLNHHVAEATTAATSSDSGLDTEERKQDLAVRKVRRFTRHRLDLYRDKILRPLRHASKSYQGRKRAPKIIETEYYRFRGWAKDSNVYVRSQSETPMRCTTIRWFTPKEDYRNLDPQKQRAVEQSVKKMDKILNNIGNSVREERNVSRSRAYQDWPLKLVEDSKFIKKFSELRSTITDLEELVSFGEPRAQINSSGSTIKTMYEGCITAYGSVLEIISKPEDMEKPELFDNLEWELDSLKSWARKAGVLLEDQASFDYKLRGNPKLQHEIMDVLLQQENTVTWIEKIQRGAADLDGELSCSDSGAKLKSVDASLPEETAIKESRDSLNESNCSLWHLWSLWSRSKNSETLEDEVPSKAWAYDENAAALLSPRRAAVVDLARDLTEDCILQYRQIVYRFDKPDDCSKIRELPPESTWCRDHEALKEWAKKARLRGYQKDSPKRNYQEGLEYDFCNARFEDQLSTIECLKHMRFRLIRLLKERQSNHGMQEDLHTNPSSTPKSWKSACNFGPEIRTLERLVQPSNTPSGLEGDACRTIETFYQTCLGAYAITIDHLDRAEERIKQKLSSPEAIQHQLRDLESWALDTGLLSQGKDSLEYRLMYTEGNKACEGLCRKLRKIESTLQEMIPLITGEQIPWEDQAVSDSDTDSHSDSATELQQYVNSLASYNEDLNGITDAYELGNRTKPVSSPDDNPACGRSLYTDPITNEPITMKGLEDLEIGTEEGTASI